MPDASPIPKVLHQIWVGRGEMPEHQRRWRRRFAEMNPDWTLHLWTDDELPFPILNRRAWDACLAVGATPGCAMRSDILRLELMARVGGVYLDTDIKPVRPLRPAARWALPPESRASRTTSSRTPPWASRPTTPPHGAPSTPWRNPSSNAAASATRPARGS